MKNQRVAIYYDGSNFYHKLRGLGVTNATYFDYYGFSLWLAKKRKIISNRYYVGIVRAEKKNKKAQKMRSAQQKLFYFLLQFLIVPSPPNLLLGDGDGGVEIFQIKLAVFAFRDRGFFHNTHLISQVFKIGNKINFSCT